MTTVDTDDEAPRRPAEHRALGIALALLAFAALLYAQASHAWLASPSGNAGFGLRTTSSCIQGDDGQIACTERAISGLIEAWLESPSAFEREHASSIFPYLGWGTTALIGLGQLGLLLSTLAALAKTRPQWSIAPTTIALLPLLLALVTGCTFCALKPGEPSYVGVSVGFWVFGAGAVCALVGALLLAPVLRPLDPDLTADAMNPDEF